MGQGLRHDRGLWESLASLYSVHAFNYLVPLFTLPYLARVLGPIHWGELAFAEAYASLAGTAIEYGFGLSATREVAQRGADPAVRSDQLAGVLGAQFVLTGVIVLATWGAARYVPRVSAYGSLLPLALLLAVARSVNPIWYFQGIEKLGPIATFTVCLNLVAAGAVFVLVRDANGAWISLALRAAAMAICSAVGFLMAYRDTPFSSPTWDSSWTALRQGRSLFFSKSAISLYTAANVVLMGFLTTPAAVAWFAGGEKLARAASSAVAPISQAFYPRIAGLLVSSKLSANRALLQSVWLTLGVGLAAGTALFALAPLLVRMLLGPGFGESVPVVRLLAVVPLLIAGSNLLGIQWMVPLRLDREFTFAIAMGGGVNLIAARLLAPRFQQQGMALSVLLAESVVAFLMVVILWWLRKAPWKALSGGAGA